MRIKQLSVEAFTAAKPYDWRPWDWEMYAIVLAWDLVSYPNAPVSLEARINLRNN